MLPASLRQRLSRLNSLHPSVSSSQEPLDLGYSHDFASEPRMISDSARDDPTGSSSRPATADSKESTPSVSTYASGATTPEAGRSTAVSSYEGDSGLKWNRVVPAFNLLRIAGFEAQQPNSDTRLVRSLFINGLGYLLEALPPDLSSQEARSLQDRLPESIKLNLSLSSESTLQRRTVGPNPPSYLHRIIATVIFYGFILLQFVVPYARMLLKSAYRYERNHRITARFLSVALETADGIGKSANNVGLTLLTLGEGKFGAAVVNLVAWLIEAVAGGVYDGVGEGLVVLGVIRPNTDLQQRQPGGWSI